MLWQIKFYGAGGPGDSKMMYLVNSDGIKDVLNQVTEILGSSGYCVVTGVTEITVKHLQELVGL